MNSLKPVADTPRIRRLGGRVPPTLDSRAPAAYSYVFPAGRPGSRSAGSPSPSPSRRRRCGPWAGMGSNADPGAMDGETSSYLKRKDARVVESNSHLQPQGGSIVFKIF